MVHSKWEFLSSSETVRLGRSIVVIQFLLREKRGSVGRSEGSATALLAATNVSDSIGVWSRCANPRLVASISCHESLRGPLACEAGCARSISNDTTHIMIIQATLNLCCMMCNLTTHTPSLQTRYTDHHIEATCSSHAFTK